MLFNCRFSKWSSSFIGSSEGLVLLSLLNWLLVDDVEHLSLDSLLLENKPILIPNEVGLLGVVSVSLHAAFEQADDIPVVWVLGEC